MANCIRSKGSSGRLVLLGRNPWPPVLLVGRSIFIIIIDIMMKISRCYSKLSKINWSAAGLMPLPPYPVTVIAKRWSGSEVSPFKMMWLSDVETVESSVTTKPIWLWTAVPAELSMVNRLSVILSMVIPTATQLAVAWDFRLVASNRQLCQQIGWGNWTSVDKDVGLSHTSVFIYTLTMTLWWPLVRHFGCSRCPLAHVVIGCITN